MKTGTLSIIVACLAVASLQGCKHPLAIVGEGNIVDVNESGHGCTFKQFQADDTACTQNEVSGDYHVNYKAKPRPGWRFVRWEGPCSPDSDFQKCRLNASEAEVTWWDENYPDETIPSSTAVFQPINGETGFLVAPDPVAGVTYETPSSHGVTGLDGSFQYKEGEIVRFLVGDTLLGEVTGRAQVTPFELAASEVLTGTARVKEALGNEDDPFHAVINISTLLHSLDHDAKPENGIEIRQSVAALFSGMSLDVSQDWEAFAEEFGLRHAMGEANIRHLFSKLHGIVKPESALRQLYNTFDIDPLLTGVSEYYSGTMDTPDSESVSRWQYNKNGYVTRYEGTVEHPFSSDRETHLYNLNYDRDGNLTRYELSIDDEGLSTVESREHDIYGNLILIEMARSYRDLPSETRHYEYNALGSVTSEKVAWDNDGYGSQEGTSTYKYDYDAKGNLTRKRVAEDRDRNGSQEEKWTYKYDYDAKGNMTRQRETNDGDGSQERTSTYKYDARGNLAEYHLVNGNCSRYVYDDQDNLTQYQDSKNCDAKLRQNKRYQYDNQGNLTKKIYVWVIESWEYDENNNPTRYVRNGVPTELPYGERDQIITWQYDNRGNPTSKESRSYGRDNSQYVEYRQYQYDNDGNLTREDDGNARVEIYKYRETDWGHLFSDYYSLPPLFIWKPILQRPQPAPPNPFPTLP